MERPGQRLERVREKLKLTYRDVERASQRIAAERQSDEFAIALSRLADIEHKGTVPTIYRLYSLCVIYRLNLCEVLQWYGVPLDTTAADIFQTPLAGTHPVEINPPVSVPVPQPDGSLDPGRTTLLTHLAKRWGKTGLSLLNGIDLKAYRYGLIGTDDWSMFPLLPPGTLVLIDQSRRKIAAGGWTSEIDRPIYFLETRDGYRCGWCSKDAGRLIYQPHPSSSCSAEIFLLSDVDLIGQVIGAAMHFLPRDPTRS